MSCDWLMIDGPSLIFRAYYGTRARISGKRGASSAPGQKVNAIPSFLDRFARLIAQRRPRHLVIAEDRAWRPGWRVELIPSYKSHRVEEPVPPALAPQIPVIAEILQALGVDVLGADDHEAEDVIATLAKRTAGAVEIVSGDRDLFALVEGSRVRVLYPEKSGLTVIDEDEVSKRYQIPGRRYGDFAVLRGDPSDGLPGLKGVGSVAAAGMIRRYRDLDGVLRNRPLRDADREYLVRAMRVVAPVADLPIALPPGSRESYPVDEPRVRSLVALHDAEEACGRLVSALQSLPHG